MPDDHVHFVTGRLAGPALRALLDRLAPQLDFEYSVDVLPISVAALMTPAWIAPRLRTPSKATRVILPGYCQGDLAVVREVAGVPVERGPKDLRQLEEYFGRSSGDSGYGEYDIEILAEINHAPRLPLAEILNQARQLQQAGADVIDVGCEPGDPWTGVAQCVRALRDSGHRVSIDSFHPLEVAAAVRAGAELVLSVNSTNRAAAPDWGCEVVLLPDETDSVGGLDESAAWLAARHVSFRIDPVLAPIGCGFAASLGRYLEVRRRFPDVPMLMGIGNLTELTDADSAAINLLLLGFCQEVGIHSILTTQVINWARTSVDECHLARALVYHAIRSQSPPKNVTSDLVLLRDARLWTHGTLMLQQMARQLTDHNYRIFAEDGELHLLSAGLHLHHHDPFRLMSDLLARSPANIDAEHAFYLGFELSKAAIALMLGKHYEQDTSLNWGYLTRTEDYHRLGRHRKRKQ